MSEMQIAEKNQVSAELMETVIVKGDLADLTPVQRVEYYRTVCESLGLNYLTRPFDYITLNKRLTLYAKKDATDQLRKLNQVSIDDVKIDPEGTSFIVTVKGHDASGRSDVEIGVVSKNDMGGNQANAMMKAVTKAKRRLTLSLCGLGWLDETEVETIPDARPVTVSDTGEIIDTPKVEKPKWDEDKFLLEYQHKAGLPQMALDKAMAFETSEGHKYGDLEVVTLYGMSKSIERKMATLQTDYEKESYLNKLGAINEILSAKANERQLAAQQPDPFTGK